MYVGLSVQLHNLPDDTDLEEVVRILREQIAEFIYTDGPPYDTSIMVDIEETAGGQTTCQV